MPVPFFNSLRLKAVAIGNKFDSKNAMIYGVALGAVSLAAFYWPSLRVLLTVYSTIDSYSHGFIVPLVSAYATFELFQMKRSISLRPSWWGLPIFLAGTAILLFGYWYYIALFTSLFRCGFIFSIGLLLSIVGLYVTAGGFGTLRVFGFPLAYLFFAIPFPQSTTQILTNKLRSIVSVLCELTFTKLGMIVHREGNVLHLAAVSLGIDDACTGIQSFWMLVACAVLMTYLYKLGIAETAFICLLTIPISVLMNALRIVATGLLVSNVSRDFSGGWRHEFCGWLTFVFGVSLVMLLGKLFSHPADDIERTGDIPPPAVSNDGSGSPGRMRVVTLLITVIFVSSGGVLANFIITRHYDWDKITLPDQNRKMLTDMPKVLGSFYQIKDLTLADDLLLLRNPDDYITRQYRNDNDAIVELRISYWAPGQFKRKTGAPMPIAGVSVHHPDECFQAWGYESVDEYRSEVMIVDLPVESVSVRLFRNKSGHEQFVLFWYKKEEENMPKVRYNPLAVNKILLDSWKQPFESNVRPQYLVFLIVKSTNSFESANAVAIDFIKTLGPMLPQFNID